MTATPKADPVPLDGDLSDRPFDFLMPLAERGDRTAAGLLNDVERAAVPPGSAVERERLAAGPVVNSSINPVEDDPVTDFAGSDPVYSPRWGHDDTYHLTFAADGLTVRQNAHVVTCRFPRDGDPVWEGCGVVHRPGVRLDPRDNPLVGLFRNDAIYAPDVTVWALEWAYRQWQAAAVSDADLADGLSDLFGWVSRTAAGRPRGELWAGGV